MSLRAKIVLYMVTIHAILAAVVVFVLIDRPWLLLLFELLFTVSGVLGYVLVKSFFVPLQLIRTGAELLRERDFTTHFREIGQPEMDELIRIYNRMVDRLRHERMKLEEQNLFLDKILTASPTGVVTLDHDGRISQINPGAEHLIGIPADRLMGRKLAETDAPVAAAMARLEADQVTLVSPDGRRRLRCRRAEFFDRGFPRAFFLIEELTDELRASEKAAYGKVIRLMSHEVNNSVGAVRSLLESCRTYGDQLREDDRRDYDQAIEIASGRLHRLNTFMKGLASVARVPTPDRRPCDVVELLRDVVLLLGAEIDRRKIAVTWDLDDPVPSVELDKNQIEQVLVNVLRNAVEAIHEDGTITIGAGRDHGRLYVSIRDSGPGVPDELRPLLFTPFFSTKRDGQGIGLTLVQEILTQHDFDFSLGTHASGGAEFRVVF